MARSPSRETVGHAADALRRLLDAVERGEVRTTEPREVTLIRRLEGVLAGWEAALGEPAQLPDHSALPSTKGAAAYREPSSG